MIMEIIDDSLILELIILFVLSMLIVSGCYCVLRKINDKSRFLCYTYDFPYWKKYNRKKY